MWEFIKQKLLEASLGAVGSGLAMMLSSWLTTEYEFLKYIKWAVGLGGVFGLGLWWLPQRLVHHKLIKLHPRFVTKALIWFFVTALALFVLGTVSYDFFWLNRGIGGGELSFALAGWSLFIAVLPVSVMFAMVGAAVADRLLEMAGRNPTDAK